MRRLVGAVAVVLVAGILPARAAETPATAPPPPTCEERADMLGLMVRKLSVDRTRDEAEAAREIVRLRRENEALRQDLARLKGGPR